MTFTFRPALDLAIVFLGIAGTAFAAETHPGARFVNDHPRFCELEPIGPVEDLAPGQSASFTEEWWLHAFRFPADRQPDLAAIRARVAASAAEAQPR